MKLKPKTSGPDVGLTLRMTPLAPAEPPCEIAIDGLYWFSDASGAFDATAEASYLLPEGGAGPTLAVAKLLGETCDGEVNWSTSWTPQDVGGGAPGIWSDGSDLIVYPLEDTTPGILSVSSTIDGIEYGPIALVLVRYACYGYGSGAASCASLTGINWDSGGRVVYESGSGWSHTGTISGTFPPGTTFAWTFAWTGSPSNSPSFSESGASCTISRSAGSGSGTAYCIAAVSSPGCADVYTDYLYVSVT